jgi:tetratricopeptide (TPR) repeat protein
MSDDADSRPKDLAFEIQFYEALLADDPDYADALVPLAEAYTKAGLYDKGLQADQRLARLRPADPTVHYNLACSYALTAHKDEALDMLERAVELGYRDADFMLHDEDLVSLRDDERFAQLIGRFFGDTNLNTP